MNMDGRNINYFITKNNLDLISLDQSYISNKIIIPRIRLLGCKFKNKDDSDTKLYVYHGSRLILRCSSDIIDMYLLSRSKDQETFLMHQKVSLKKLLRAAILLHSLLTP